MIAKNNDKITRAIKRGNKNNDLFMTRKKVDEKEGGATDGRIFNNANKKERETDGRRYSKKKKGAFCNVMRV